jgi:tetratricopeptide (TPR) repeat protein
MIASIHLKEKKYEKAQHYAIEALSRSKRSMLSEYIQVVSREPINYSRIREELSNIKEAWPNYVRVINTIGDCFMKENLFEEARLSFCECYSLNKSFL